jgi:hypothetical protein
MLLIQHVGGVSTLLKGKKSNPAHRMLGFYVSNFGRILTVFGFVIAKVDQNIIYGSGAITLLLLVASTYKVFFAKQEPEKAVKTNGASANVVASPRNKSPKRD